MKTVRTTALGAAALAFAVAPALAGAEPVETIACPVVVDTGAARPIGSRVSTDAPVRGAGPACPNCVLELQFMMDNAFSLTHGANAPQVARDAIDRANEIMSAPQSAGGLELRLVDTYGTEFSGPTPWTPSSNAITLLSNFAGWVDVERPVPGEERDLVMLFSGIDLDGSVLGLSFNDSLCSSNAIGLVSMTSDDAEFNAYLIVHAIGHILNAGHDSVDNACDAGEHIMSAFVNPLSPPSTFSDCSIDEVNAYVAANGACLDTYPCSAVDYAEPYDALDFSDVVEFLVLFAGMHHTADLAEDFGSFDFNDVIAFLTAFGAGCP